MHQVEAGFGKVHGVFWSHGYYWKLVTEAIFVVFLLQGLQKLRSEAQILPPRPSLFRWVAQDSEYFVYLVQLSGSNKERRLKDELSEYTANTPHIYSFIVLLDSQQQLRSPIPQRNHQVRVLLDRLSVCPRQAKITYLENSSSILVEQV